MLSNGILYLWGELNLILELVRKTGESVVEVLIDEAKESEYMALQRILEFVVHMWVNSGECTKV